ncbi:ATP-binding protein [Micromonospora sp. RHAY321]|uniref:AlbA family DNA-binding domain-containing protein n=1 Tax=Micromonospora sp. RHAY321 TaxID=2944807 RepID=UPI00207C4987|nr:ATP-binding protein [Micromonospora sp. RHAY321]MCO1597419.1 ATP-binding protein [Micromonospora sp. RHAY321]
MVALRSRRLESIFGTALDTLASHHIHALVTAGVQEAFDLDFKQTLYGGKDQEKRALAGDVAALANTGGGVIVLGVEEDDQARATKAPGVAISDAEVARMRQSIASLVAPMPAVDILTVPEPTTGVGDDDTQQGFIVVAVPRSPGAPHAVLINDGLRFPVRNGATTRYLSEPEVATAYRNRFASAQRQDQRIVEVEREAISRLAMDDNYAWVIVSLVPDLPGDMILQDAFRAWEMEIRRRPTITDEGVGIHRTRVGRRRLLADGTSNYAAESRFVSLELHTDGSGAFALGISNLGSRRATAQRGGEPDDSGHQVVTDEGIAAGIVSGLLQLGRHARDRAAAGGTALIRAQLHPVGESRPTTIGHTRFYGMGETRTGEQYQVRADPAEAAAAVDDLAQPGPALIEAGALLLDELGQAFGVPEMGQLTRDGRIRRGYWSSSRQSEIVQWAEAYGIEVTEEGI